MTTLRFRHAALLALAVLALSQSASAASPPAYSSFSIRPVSGTTGYFVLDGNRGDRLVGSFRVVNTGTKAGTALLHPVDATTGVTSGAVYLDRIAKRRGAGRWIALPVKRVTLRPGQAKVVRFTVSVPRSSRAGHHLGGIVAENLELTAGQPSSKGAGLQVRVRHLSVVAVQVNLPGREVAKMGFHGVRVGVSTGYEVLHLAFRNAGNVLLRPRLALQVTDVRGRVVVREARDLDTFVPQTQIPYPFYLTGKPLASGTYELAGTLSYAKRVTRFRATFVISPTHVKELEDAKAPGQVGVESEARTVPLLWALIAGALVGGLLLGGIVMRLVLLPARRERT
jgi:hypothetical protein